MNNLACGLRSSVAHPRLEIPLDAKKKQPTRFSSVFRCERCFTGVLNTLPDELDISNFYGLDAYYTQGDVTP